MQQKLAPFNLDLLIPSSQDLNTIRPIKVLDIFDGQSKNFHQDGLFSTEIFGKVGEERRNRFFSYIDLNTEVFHPIIFKAIGDLKELYIEIIAGKTYATFDEKIKDFIKSDMVNGKTGYAFFMSKFKDLKFEERASTKREFNIRLINKFKDKSMYNKLIVLPAGLRDFVIDENGKPSEDEINNLYRKVLAISSILKNVGSSNLSNIDPTKYNLQLAINSIFDYIVNFLEGKNGFILGKWASRKILDTTRNVITSNIPDTTELNGPRSVSVNQTVVGLHQYIRSIMPLAIQKIRDNFLSKVFIGPNSPAILVNKKTLKKEMVSINPRYFDSYMTYEGLSEVIASYDEENLRHEYLEISDYYIGLIYLGNDRTYKFIQDIDDVPEDRRKDIIRPITFTELLYISVCSDSKDIPCLVTRYPITGYGSIYPSYVYLKTTSKSEHRLQLDDNWQPFENNAIEFPIKDSPFFNSMSPATAHLKRLGADFDGDMMSFICLLTNQAKDEIKNMLNSKNYYVDVNGNMFFSVDTDITSLVLSSMTG